MPYIFGSTTWKAALVGLQWNDAPRTLPLCNGSTIRYRVPFSGGKTCGYALAAVRAVLAVQVPPFAETMPRVWGVPRA